MSTALEIINKAFSKAGIRASETPLSAAEVSEALDSLNDMLAAWGGDGTIKGVEPIANVGDEIGEPREVTWALKANLALVLLGEYGIPATPAHVKDARESLDSWLSVAINLSNLDYPSTLPRGSGNSDGCSVGLEENFFPNDHTRNF